jgi:hypothetical protein
MSAQLQFEPFASIVDTTFWHTLSRKKLEEIKLDSAPLPVRGSYALGSKQGTLAAPARFHMDSQAFSDAKYVSLNVIHR